MSGCSGKGCLLWRFTLSKACCRVALLAPSISKLAVFDPVVAASQMPGVQHCDLWLDDCSLDVTHADADIVAAQVEVYRSLKTDLSAQGLQVNVKKTHFTCSSAKAEKCLKKILQEGDPEVSSVVKDLGVDSAGGRRRRITTQAKRFGLAARRNKRLHVLRLPRRPQRTRVHREGQGIAPKRLKTIRAALSRHAGRTALGLVDVSFKVEDPLFTIVRQRACTLIRIYAVAQPVETGQGSCFCYGSVSHRPQG